MRILPVFILCLASLVASATPPPQPASPRWEQVDEAAPEPDEEFSAGVRNGYLYVWLARPCQVELFTILGQPVARATLPGGASRLRLPARGIYILKAGSSTKRITM